MCHAVQSWDPCSWICRCRNDIALLDSGRAFHVDEVDLFEAAPEPARVVGDAVGGTAAVGSASCQKR